MSAMTKIVKPRIILGVMTFGPDIDKGARITSLSAYERALDCFQAEGYQEIDTARVYVGGKQEAFTRQANWLSRGLQIATKVYPTAPGMHAPEQLELHLNESLQELGAECVDIFYLHAPDRSVPFLPTLQSLDRLHRQGKFKRWGLSNFTAFEVSEIVMHCRYNNLVEPVIWQGMYNAITRSIEAELIPVCRRYGLEIVVYNPLAGGLFSGKILSANTIPSEGRFSNVNNAQGRAYRDRYFRDTTFSALRAVETVAHRHGLTLLETAFRWLLHHSALRIGPHGNDGVIIGVSNHEQLEQNLMDLTKGPLPQDVVHALDDAWLSCKPSAPNYWHLNLEYTYNTKEAL